ncbi:MAG: hypothetical protein JXA41_08950 [Deltaproteobacteria bacterium]|nr:hypothetical protein [Deltaproteobacteria bacterium]
MKRLMILCGFLVIGLAGMSHNGFAAGFTKEAVEFEARSLVNRMEITRDMGYKLKIRLAQALNDPSLQEIVDSKGVGAVFAYAAGEGGLVLKYMEGDGLISFADGLKAVPISLKSWSVGAMIGGSAQWGIGLVIGPVDEKDFGGGYKGGTRTATAWEAATRSMLYVSRTVDEQTQEIYIITTGRGFSAGVGGVVMSITPVW